MTLVPVGPRTTGFHVERPIVDRLDACTVSTRKDKRSLMLRSEDRVNARGNNAGVRRLPVLAVIGRAKYANGIA